MRTQRSWAVAVLLALATVSHAQRSTQPPKPQTAGTSAGDDSSRLPVKRVVLYKNGVGYFEHSARVRGNQDLNIDFTTAQLNDVLKSLTAVDLGEGRISGVRYNSIAPLEERLKVLRLPFGEAVTRADFLSALRGARVEVRGKGETATGRLLSVEQEDRTNDSGVTNHRTVFSVITDSGEMRNFDLGSGVFESCAPLFSRFGGHAHAVGFSLPCSRIKELQAHMDLHARSCLTLADFEPVVHIDLELPLDAITPDLFEAVRRIEPFGAGNPEPVFSASAARLSAPPKVLKDIHAKLRFTPGPAAGNGWRRALTHSAMAWRMAQRIHGDRMLPGDSLDLAFTLDHNEHPDFGGIELSLRDYRVIARIGVAGSAGA